MSYVTETLGNLIHQTAFFNLSWGNLLMILVALVFLYLAIKKGYEPLLLVPIAFGMLLVNMYPKSWQTRKTLQTVLEDYCIISIFWTSGVFCRL